jgi:hypothetical protein
LAKRFCEKEEIKLKAKKEAKEKRGEKFGVLKPFDGVSLKDEFFLVALRLSFF